MVGNALKYTTAGSIGVSLTLLEKHKTESGRSVVLVVSDTGSGMSENHLRNHLFTPFMQEDALYEGTGLGMSIVKQLLESLGGSITVSSKLGSGTKVTLSVPLGQQKIPSPTSTTQYPELKIAMLALYAPDAASSTLRNACSQSLRDWYGVNLIEMTRVEDNHAQIVVINETELYLLSQETGSHDAPVVITGKCAFIIACVRHGIHARENHVQSDRVFYLYPPYGPHQVGSVLQAALSVNVSNEVTLEVLRKGDSRSFFKIIKPRCSKQTL